MSEVKPEVFATIKNLFATKTRRRLFENFLSLSFLQFANYIFPLITLPYLVRVLGPEKYGLIAFAQAFIGYFQILTDYGFNLSATREISINRENKEKVSEIFSSVMIIKFFLLLLSLGLMSIIVFSFKKFSQDWLIYYLTFGMVLGQTLFPIWFFQGMERMRYITFLNVLAKLIFTIAIFIFVKRSSDYFYVPLLNSLGFIVAGVLALWIVFRDFEVNFKIGGLSISYYLKDGWNVFISRIYAALYTNFNILLLGIITNNIIVGYYSAVEKIVSGISSIYYIINQVIYPYMSRLKKHNLLKFSKKAVVYYILFFIPLALVIAISSHIIVKFMIGQYIRDVQIIFLILLFSIVTNGIGGLVTQVLIILKKYKEFNQILFATAILNGCISPFAIYILQGIGLAISVILIQFFVISMCLRQIYKEYIIGE